MQLTIGSQTIEIVSAAPQRDLKFGIYLAIKIAKGNITTAEIESIFDNNTEVITVTDDNGNVTEYGGYSELGKYSYDEGYYYISQICVSEAQHQINMLKNQNIAQAAINADVEQALANQMSTNLQVSEALTAQEATNSQVASVLNTQTEQVNVLTESTAMQMASMDSLLLDVLPAIITDAVTIAVAEALANNTTSEEVVEETPVEETETVTEE